MYIWCQDSSTVDGDSSAVNACNAMGRIMPALKSIGVSFCNSCQIFWNAVPTGVSAQVSAKFSQVSAHVSAHVSASFRACFRKVSAKFPHMFLQSFRTCFRTCFRKFPRMFPHIFRTSFRTCFPTIPSTPLLEEPKEEGPQRRHFMILYAYKNTIK